jgi:steroid delta-isomerase-like uncharacterized protein
VGLLLSSTREVVERYLTALNAHDPDAVAACVAEDFVNEHTSTMGHSRRGRAEYRRALDDFLADFGNLQYEIEQVLVDGAAAAVRYRMSFALRSAAGRAVTVRGVFVFEVGDGLITHRVDYWDSGEVERQLS